MDQNKPRSASDNLAILGKIVHNGFCCGGKWVLRYKQKKDRLNSYVEKMDVVDFALKRQSWMPAYLGHPAKRADAESSLVALSSISFEKLMTSRVFDFGHKLSRGKSFRGSPALTFRKSSHCRKWAEESKSHSCFCLAVYAWNAWRKGKQLKYFAMGRGSDFPQLSNHRIYRRAGCLAPKI